MTLLEPPKRGRLRSIVLAITVAALICGCGADVDNGTRIRLPESGPSRPCMGVDGPYALVSTPLDARSPVSAIVRTRMVPVRWPTGFTATFNPELTVWSLDGSVVLKAGQDLPAGIWGVLFVCASTQGVDVYAVE